MAHVHGRALDTVRLLAVPALPHVDGVTVQSEVNLGLMDQPTLVYARLSI